MEEELKRSGVDIRINCDAKAIHVKDGKIESVEIDAKGATRTIQCDAVVSNANIRQTIFGLVGEEKFDRNFIEDAKAVRLNNSSTQVYMALPPGDVLDVNELGDLLFSSTAPYFRTEALLSREITSRTYSFYYPKTRPDKEPRCLIVSSTNANYQDWSDLPEEEYTAANRIYVRRPWMLWRSMYQIFVNEPCMSRHRLLEVSSTILTTRPVPVSERNSKDWL